jgi:PAS domain S-box-containing protein
MPHLLSQILDTCITGITLSDPHQPDNPIVYANEMFELMTGYNRDEIIGRNCRFLQGEDQDQPALEEIRAAIRSQTSVTVTLRNYRKDGELFFNRLTIRPIFDPENCLMYYLGLQYDITNQVRADEEFKKLKRLLREIDRTP